MFEEEIKILTGKDTVRGCRYFEELSKESSKSDKYYEMTDELYPLLESANAYVRIRSFSLIFRPDGTKIINWINILMRCLSFYMTISLLWSENVLRLCMNF